MRHRSRLANLPIRAAAGAFIMESGLSKWKADEETAKRLHGFASGTYPMLESTPPEKFVKGLAATEIALGGALLAPVVIGDGLAGMALTSFASGLLGLYAKTPGLRRDGGVRPSHDGVAIAKDIWLAGIGLTLMSSAKTTRRSKRLERKAKKRTTAVQATA